MVSSDAELNNDSKSDMFSEVEDMDDGRSKKQYAPEMAPLVRLQREKFQVLKLALPKRLNQIIVRKKPYKNIPHKPIIILEILDDTKFTKLIETQCDPNFMVDIAGRLLKITTESKSVKDKIINFLNELSSNITLFLV